MRQQQQQKKRLPTIPAFRKQQQASSSSDATHSVGGQRGSKNNHGASRRRAWRTAVNTQKLRQREEREIKELEARIEVEMPLPGLSWVPLLSADVAKLRGAAQHLPDPEVNQAATTSHGLRGCAAESSPSKKGLEKGETLTTTRLATAAGTLPASAGEDRLTASRAARADLTEGRQGVSTATAGENGRDLAVARAAATAAEEGGNAPTLSRYFFTDLPLSNHTQRGLRDGGFVLMSQIQLRVIPHALRGADVMGEAKTGSGKTLAFLVPVLECLYRNRVCSIDGVSALILAPTRELAVQIFNVLKVVSRYHEFSAGCLIGGKNVTEEAERVHTLNIVVGTPGRVLQHTEESQLWDATNLKILVIDEADRLADMGFIQTTRFIIEQLPADRQTLFFSATLRTAVKRLASFAARPDAEFISVGGEGGLRESGVAAAGKGNNSSSSSSDSSCNPATPLTLTQSYMIVPPQFKLSALFSFLRTHSNKKTLVFVSSCKQARFVAEIFKLLKPGPKLFFLHGRQKQARRIEVFHAFVQRSLACCLISTDLASRGIDFAQLSVGMPAAFGRSSSTGNSSSRGRRTDPHQQRLKGRALTGKAEHGGGDLRSSAKGAAAGAVDFVVQLDCPDSVETYIHRVGRTARMQRSGHALLLLLPSERTFVSRLKARKIEPKETFINPQRAVKIENKLQALLASNVELKQLAQQALGCYLRCIALMPDKQVFSVPSDRQTLILFANAYGLQLPPKITFLSANSSVDSSASSSSSSLDKTVDGEEDIRSCGGALGASALKKKNLSKLERLKEKIRQRRKEKQERARMESSGGTTPGEAFPHAATPNTTLEPVSVAAAASKPKKITSSEAAVAPDAAVAVAEASTSDGERDSSSGGSTGKRACCGSKLKPKLQEEKEQDDSDEQLFLVRKQKPDEQDDDAEDTQRLLQERLMQMPGFKRERLRFRADGSAKVKGLAAAELSRQHVFFNEQEEDDEDEHKEEREHRDLAARGRGEAKQSKTELMSADISTTEVTANSKESALIEKGRSGECSGSRRDAFLATMRTRLSLQELADKERDRQRIQERHTQRRVKERLRRQAEAAGLKGQGVGGQAALAPTAVLGSASDVGGSDYEQDTEEDKEEGEKVLDTENEMRRKAGRTCRCDGGGLAPEALATERSADSTGDDSFQGNESHELKSMMKEPRGGSTKKRYLEMAERRGNCVVKKSRQRRQGDAQRQQVHAEEASDISSAAGAREHERTSARNRVDIAEDEAARLEGVALQLLQSGVTNRSALV